MTTASHRIRLSAKERFIADIISQSISSKTFTEVAAETAGNLASGIARAAKMLALLDTKL